MLALLLLLLLLERRALVDVMRPLMRGQLPGAGVAGVVLLLLGADELVEGVLGGEGGQQLPVREVLWLYKCQGQW